MDITRNYDSMERIACIDAENYDCTRQSKLLWLSLVGYISAELALRLDMLYISGKLSYWPLNSPPPATQFMPYPLKHFQFEVSAGFVLGK